MFCTAQGQDCDLFPFKVDGCQHVQRHSTTPAANSREIAWPLAMPFGYRIWSEYGSLIALSAFATSLVLAIAAQKRKTGTSDASTSPGG